MPRTRRRGIVAVLLTAGMIAAVLAAEASEVSSPLIIPHPQSLMMLGPEGVVVGRNGRSGTRVVRAAGAELLTEAERLWSDELTHLGFAGGDHPAECTLRIFTSEFRAAGPGVPALAPEEQATLAKGDQAYVLRVRPGTPAEIDVIGGGPLGAYYGVTTLLQLIRFSGAATISVPHVLITDYPDIPYRMAADWVLKWDWEVNGYDWGDGREAFVARVKRKIDLCSRYKVNMVRFLGGRIAPGTPDGDRRYSMIQKFARELNRYARSKGVSLQYSAVSWGVDYCDWGVGSSKPWILNRRHYPDGEVYACFGGTAGCCLSNDALSRKIAERYKPLVRDWEPGSLYLHHIDLAKYAELKAVWKQRCPECRRRFPDEEPAGARGMAGAVAGLYNILIAELKSVSCPGSEYRPSRDLQIVLASPGYSYSDESDEDWQKQLVFWQEIARQVNDKRNVFLTFREQFKRLDNRGLRIEEMARTLTGAGWPGAMFVFAVQGADLLSSSNLLVSSSVLTETYRGSGALYNFNGHVFSEVQVLANANYAWNHRAPGSVDPMPFAAANLAAESQRYAVGATHSKHLYGPFLEVACGRLYGSQAAPWMAKMFRLERDRGPLCPTISWLERIAGDAQYNWTGQAARNAEAKELVERALSVCDASAKEDLKRLSQCLDVGAKYSRLLDTAHHPGPNRAAWRRAVEAGADDLRSFLEKNFRFESTEPDGGDPGCWLPLVARIRGHEIKSPAPVQPPLRESVEQHAVEVEVSSVLSGYRPASVFSSPRTGKDWGQDGGWNDGTPGQFPDVLEIAIRKPRRLREIDIYTLADNWRNLSGVDDSLKFHSYGIT